jgi:hypothetical protein
MARLPSRTGQEKNAIYLALLKIPAQTRFHEKN